MLQSVKGHLYLIMRGKEIPAKSWSTPKEDTEEITCKHSHAKITEDSDSPPWKGISVVQKIVHHVPVIVLQLHHNSANHCTAATP